VACANGPAESGVACLLAPRRERRGFSLGPLSTSSAAVHACSGDVANAQIAVIAHRPDERKKRLKSEVPAA
jgi:hypothetical protein